MQPFLGFVLQLVGNTATPFLSCISMSCVAIERCYGNHTTLVLLNGNIATSDLGCKFLGALLQYMGS